MDENPYQPPSQLEQAPQSRAATIGTREFMGSVLFPVLWTTLLFFGLPTAQRIPLELRIISTAVSLAAAYSLAKSAQSWWHLTWAPLYLTLLYLQYLIWTFPIAGLRPSDYR